MASSKCREVLGGIRLLSRAGLAVQFVPKDPDEGVEDGEVS